MRNDPYLITIHKPIHGTYCSIRLKTLNECIRNGQNMRICISGLGCAEVDPHWWYDNAVEKKKMVGRYAKSPMMMIFNHVPLPGILKQRKDISQDQIGLF